MGWFKEKGTPQWDETELREIVGVSAWVEFLLLFALTILVVSSLLVVF